MGTKVPIVIRLTFLATALALEPAFKCPDGCFCDTRRLPDLPGEVGLKIDCHPLAGSATNVFNELPINTVSLDMSRYGLDEITEDMFKVGGGQRFQFLQ